MQWNKVTKCSNRCIKRRSVGEARECFLSRRGYSSDQSSSSTSTSSTVTITGTTTSVKKVKEKNGFYNLKTNNPNYTIQYKPGQKRSIVLQDGNAVMDAWNQKAEFKAQVKLGLRRTGKFPSDLLPVEPDKRENREEEVDEWENDPYLKILSSPIRMELVGRKKLASGFLVRLGMARYETQVIEGEGNTTTATTSSSLHLVPSGISPSRPKYPGKGFYILCWRTAVTEWRKFQTSSLETGLIKVKMNVSPLLTDHVEAHLREAVYEYMKRSVDEDSSNNQEGNKNENGVRRLTLDEFNRLDQDGRLGLDDKRPYCIVYFSQTSKPEKEITQEPKFSKLVELKKKKRNDDDNKEGGGNGDADGTLFAHHLVPVYDLSSFVTIRKRKEVAPAQAPATNNEKKKASSKEEIETDDQFEYEFDEKAAKMVLDMFDSLSSSSSSMGRTELYERSDEKLINAWVVRGPVCSDMCVALWRWRMWVGEGWKSEAQEKNKEKV